MLTPGSGVSAGLPAGLSKRSRIETTQRRHAPEADDALPRSALRVWIKLACLGALAGWIVFSPTWLAPELNMSRSAIFDGLRALADRGYIERGRAGRLTSARCVVTTGRGHE